MTTKKKFATPRSKAKTAYGLLSDVARVVLAEPLRLRMGTWLADADDLGYLEIETPACGTVGCVAGWAIQLGGSREQIAHAKNFGDVEVMAVNLPGLPRPDNDQ